MFTTRNWVGLVLVLTALTVFGPRCKAQVISCSSDDGRRHYCPVDAPGRIRLSQQRSESACQEGYSWGADDRNIWVDHGCRGDFVIEPYRERPPVTISCSSDDGRRHYCQVDTRGRVRLAQQHSESPCREGHSWGADNRGIWVDHGCRADFVIEGRRWDRDHDRDHDSYRGDDQPAPDQIISCSSDDERRHYCPVDTRGGVRLLKQNSETPCRQGESWDYDDRGIWVDHGCRADFQVVR